MKLLLSLNIFSVFILCTLSFAGTDKRVFHHSVHTVNPRKVSVFYDYTDISVMDRPVKIWDGLWVRVLNMRNKDVKEGVFAYNLQFSGDQDFTKIILPINQPIHGITSESIAAFHFRNSDNSGPNVAGPKNVNAPQDVRLIEYSGFNAEIRIINFEITGTGSEESVPSFAGIQFLITLSKKVSN